MKVTDLKNTIETLVKFPLFSKSTPMQLNDVIYHLYQRKYKKGQVLFTEGDPRERIYFLINGYIRLERTNKNGANGYGDYLKPYTLFPYHGMFKADDYHYTATALTDVELYYIPTVYFEKMVMQNNEQMLHIIHALSSILEHHENRLQYTTTSHATERVKSVLTYLMDELGESEKTWITIPCPMTTTDIAHLAGTSRETVSHVISDYRKQGVLTFKNKSIQFNDPDYFHHANG
ncbi:Crp/Fnr family transcriptional regulator [Halobacillus mangrovi]|uniref:Crp/Fnr family transcriptional regulator n=1 Tax=Halobacillus mangrovi TaxID=402384 RepID=UPI003D99D41E